MNKMGYLCGVVAVGMLSVTMIIGSPKAKAEDVAAECDNSAEYLQIDFDDEHSAMFCVKDDIPLYTVNGEMLDEELQKFVWLMCNRYGCQEYYKEWLCQIYQESGFQADATNGRDWGLCQLRDTYHSYFKKLAGVEEEIDLKTNVYANIMCGTAFFAHNLTQTAGNLDYAIRLYYNSGNLQEDCRYIQDVKQWYSTVERVK